MGWMHANYDRQNIDIFRSLVRFTSFYGCHPIYNFCLWKVLSPFSILINKIDLKKLRRLLTFSLHDLSSSFTVLRITYCGIILNQFKSDGKLTQWFLIDWYCRHQRIIHNSHHLPLFKLCEFERVICSYRFKDCYYR